MALSSLTALKLGAALVRVGASLRPAMAKPATACCRLPAVSRYWTVKLSVTACASPSACTAVALLLRL